MTDNHPAAEINIIAYRNGDYEVSAFALNDDGSSGDCLWNDTGNDLASILDRCAPHIVASLNETT